MSHCRFCDENEAVKQKAGKGPWLDEPNFLEFEYLGLPCILHRGGCATWCGYVGVPKGHPAYGRDYDDVGAEVHGGLTYADSGEHLTEAHEVRTAFENGLNGTEKKIPRLWWLGFDCAHGGDLLLTIVILERDDPKFRAIGKKLGLPPHADREHYWTVAEVMEETKRLAEQLAKMTNR